MPRDLLSEIRNSGPRDLLAEMRAAEMREALKDVEREREVLADLNREDARKNESIVDRAKRTAITQAASLLPLKGAEVAAGVWAGQNPDRATEVVKKSPAALGAGAADAAAGIAGAVEGATEVYDTYAPGAQIEKKLLGRTTVSGGLGQFAKQRREGWSQLADEIAPTSDNEIVQDVLSGVRSVPTSLGAAAASIATGNPLTGAAMLGATTGGLSYGEARDAGLLPGAAAVKAAMDAGIELGTEYGPQKALSRLLKPGESLTKTLVKYGLGELGGEQLATLGQDYNQWLLVDRNKGKSFDDYLAEIPDHAKSTLIATVTTTGVVAGVGATVRAGANAADKFRARRQGAPEQPGAIDQAAREAAILTPEDEASAFRNQDILDGKTAIARDEAALQADAALEAAGLPKLGTAIEIVDPDGNAMRGTVEDVFTDGTGFKLKIGDGTTEDYYLSDINDAGDTIRPLLTAEEINAEAAARADAAKAEMERLRAEAANAPATEAPGVPTVPQTVPRPVPQAGGSTVTGEQAIAGFKARTRRAESGGKDSAKNPNSSATGRYQFIEGTFKAYYKKVYGGGDAAANAAWANKRNDPAIQEALMDRLTRDNAAGLSKAGIPVTEGNLYLAHFAGIGGATALHRNPGASVEAVLGKDVVKANGFLAGKSAGDVIAWAAGKMGGKAPDGGTLIPPRRDDEEDTWENPYTKALEEYRKSLEEGGNAPEAVEEITTAAPIPDDPSRPDPASVYAQQNVTPDAEATSPADGIGGGPPQPGGDAAAPISDEPFDADKWQGERDQRIKLSKEAGTKHLDDLEPAVETMRGKPFYNVHDPRERGIVRTVANTGDVVVDWADDYSAEKNLAETVTEGRKEVRRSWLMPSDLRDYAVGAAPTAPSPTPAVVDQPLTTSPVADRAGAVGETQATPAEGGDIPVVDASAAEASAYNALSTRRRIEVLEASGAGSLLAGGAQRNSGTPFERLPSNVQERIRAGNIVGGGATNPVTLNQTADPVEGEAAVSTPRAPIPTRPGRPEDERVNRDVAISPTGREAPVEYRVAELGDIVASHTPDGAVNPAFPAERQPRERDSSASRIQVAKIAGNLNPRLLGRNVLASDGAPIVSQGGIVEAGNGRIAALDLAYQQFPDKAQAYRDYLKQEGFDVEGMERPVLVRVLDPSVSAEDAFALTRESNQRSTAEMSVTEQAAIDAEKLTDDLVNAYRGGSPTAPANVAFVKRYFEEVADPNARATLYDDDGKMTQAAQARITAALLQRAFGNRELVKDVAESTDPDVKAIGNVLSDVAGMWARMKAAAGNGTIDPQFDITENVNEAVSIVAQARKTKRNVAEFVAQNGIFTGKIPARTEAVLRMMFRNPNFTRPTGQAPLKQMFEWYIEQAMQSSGLFASPDATPDATLSQAREKTLGEGIDVEPDAGRPGDERVRGSVREGGTGRDGPDARVPEQRGAPGEGEGRQSLSAEPSSDTDVEAGTTAEAAAPPPPSAAASAGSSRSAFEATAKSPPEPGKPFIVYRAGTDETSLANRNAGDAMGVAEHLAREDDWETPTKRGVFTTLYAYEVTVDGPFGEYERALRGKLENGGGEIGTVGLFNGGNRLTYSFGERGYSARLLGSVPIADVRAKLKELSGYDNFDDAGYAKGAEAIRAALPVFKLQAAAEPASADSSREQDLFARFPEVAAAADRILEQAAPHQQALGEFAKPFGKLFSNPGLKGKARIVEKVTSEAKYENDPATLKDIVRGAFFVDTPEQAAEAEAALRAAFTIAEDKGWQIVDGNYFDHKFIIDFGDGIRGEIQIVPAAVWEHKKGAGDKAYVQWRRIEDPQSAEAQRLLREMEAGYSKALSGTAFESAFNALKSARGNASAASAGVSSGAGTATLPGDGSQADFLSDQASANQRPSRAPVAISQPSSSKNLNNVGITSEREVTSNGEKSKAPSDYGANNRLVTQARREELRRLLQEKLNPNRLNSLIDPTILAHGAELGVFHLEAGARKFADFAKAVAADLGVRPVDLKQYLRAWYNGARDMMEDAGAPVADMDTPDQVRAALARLEAAPAAAPVANASLSPLESAFADALKTRSFATITEARAFAKDVTGEDYRPGTLEAKKLDEAIELAVVSNARAIVAKGDDPLTTFRQLVALYGRQPNLAVRTSTSVEEQAYSTPAPLAYLAAQRAGITADTTVYEPSAGHGMLLITAAPAKVTANELNADRVAQLRKLFPPQNVTQGDASRSGPEGPQRDAVIANPPFGPVKDPAGDTVTHDMGDGYVTREIDHAISLVALDVMKNDGRAALIVGSVAKTVSNREDAYNAKAKREFYYRLYSEYNVTDHFTVSGDLYKKQGAAWPVDVIVIEGRGKSALSLPAVKAPPVFDTWEQLENALAGSAQLRGDATGQDSGAAAGRAESDARDGRARSGSDRGRIDSGRERGPADEPSAVLDRPSDRQPGIPGLGEREAGSRGLAAEPRVIRESGRDRQRVQAQPALDEGAEAPAQAKYEPASASYSLGTLVPYNMQTAAQNALDRLEQRHGSVDAYVADKLGFTREEMGKRLSAEATDALGLALDNMERGAAFIIGDQTGIGKGRVVAGVLRYAMREGRPAIFVTEKPNLYADIYRDLVDVGVPEMLGRQPKMLMTNASQTVPLGKGVDDLTTPPNARHNQTLARAARGEEKFDLLMTTYAQMQTVKGETTQRQAVLEALADGAIIVFDESHNAGGQGPTDNSRKSKAQQAAEEAGTAPLNRAQFARLLARKAHGVMFSSATYAKRPEVMDLYARTDMGLAVGDPQKLGEAIAKGGVPLQQVVASALADAGQYVRRERTWEGVEYRTPRVPVDAKVYENVTQILVGIREFEDRFIEPAKTAADKEARTEAKSLSHDGSIGNAGVASTNFTSVMHNLIEQMLLALKAAPAAERALAAIERGRKPVITLANTMGSFIQEYAEDNGLKTGDPIDLDFGAMFLRYLDRTRRFTVRKPFSKEKGEKVYITDDQLGPAGLAEYRRIERLVRDTEFGNLPVSPIDYIRQRIIEAGYKVGEITGRQYAIDYKGGTPTLALRGTKETGIAGRLAAVNGFNSGKLDAMILNQSGSTGLSIHASDQFKDQRPRTMIIAQAERNVDTHMQMLGRVHRTGQVVLPDYDQLVAEVPAEMRPAAVLAKKMASLNANTTGARGSAVTGDDIPDFMNEFGDEIAARLMEENRELFVALGKPLKGGKGDGLDREGAARKVTGRLMLLPLEQQQQFYDTFLDQYQAYLAQKEAAGEAALEAKTLALDAKEIEKRTVAAATKEGTPFGDPVFMETLDVKRLGKPFSGEQVLGFIAQNTGQDVPAGDPARALDALKQRAGQWLNEQVRKPALDEFEAYRTETLDNTSDAARANVYDRLRDNRSHYMSLTQTLTPGAVVNLYSADGYAYGGIVLNIDKKGKAKNPLALSTWQVTIAVPDAAKQFVIPLSQLRTNTMPEDSGRLVESTRLVDGQPPLNAFDSMQKEAREQRVIFTGNILAAYNETNGKGQIVNFVREDGRVEPGILMRRGYSHDSEVARRPVEFRTVDQVMNWVKRNFTAYGDRVSLDMGGSDLVVTTAASKKEGAHIFLNKALRDALGTDFVKTSTGMVARAPMSKLRDVAAVLMREAGGLRAKTDLAEARELVAQEGFKESRPDLFDEPAQPTRTMTEAQRAELEARQKQGMARRGGQQGLGDQEGGLFASERDQGTLFRVSDGEPATRRETKDLERELNAVLAKIVDKRVHLVLTTREKLAGSGSVNLAPDGRWLPSLNLIEVASNAIAGARFVLNHEAVHALRKLGAISPTDWLILSNAAKKDTAAMASIKRRYPELSEEAQIEEAIADMFGRFQESAEVLGPVGRGVLAAFRKVLQLYEAVRNVLKKQGFRYDRTAGDIMRDMRAGRTKRDIGKYPGGNAQTREMVVHHGTPHEWEGDRADISKIGTGEGAQAFGWGLYFADKKSLAQHYRDKLAQRKGVTVRWNGRTWKEVNDSYPRDRALTAAEFDALQAMDMVQAAQGDIDAALADPNNLDLRGPKAWLAEHRDEITVEKPGRLYTVDIPEDGEYLLWDKPVNQQPGKIREALSRIPWGAWEQIDERLDAQGLNEVDLDDDAYTGGELYRMLSRVELDVPTDGSNGKQDASLLLKSLGIRGIKYLDGSSRNDGEGSYNYVVFDDADVKVLAKESRPPLAPVLDLAGTDPTFKGKMADAFELFRMKTQDRYITLKKAQRKIERVLGRPLPDSMDVYKGEELMHGRMAERIDRLHEKLVRPLFDAMADANVSLDELETFLYARHARERNAQIAKINPDMPDGGSGMTNTAARAILNRVARSDKAAAMNALAARVDAIRESTLDAQVEYGLISAKQAAEYRATYQAYVPLRGFKEMAADPNADPAKTARVNRSGGGINVRGPESKRAFGRRSEADSPLSYLILQAQEAIVRGETNRVGQQLYELAKNAKDGEFWTINKPTTARKLNEETGLVEEYTHHQLTAADAPYTVVVKVEGKERRVTFNRDNPNARRMADAMRRLSDSQMDWFTKSFGVVNRWLSAVNTRWNAEFVFTNMFRDLQTAAINLQGIDVPGIARKSAKHYPWALKASMKGAYGKGDQWYDEFVMEGAKTAFARIENIDDLKKDLSAEFAMAQSRAGTDKSLGLKGKRAFRRVVDIVENANDGVENAARLAAYRAAREAGVSKKQAASIAKNLTVNFNRRGQFGPVMNSLYLFYNASVQGNVRILQAMYHSKKVRGVVAGIAVAGFMSEFLNAMLSDDDDDGESFYDKIPAFEKERNMIVMLDGENYITIPMPWGYNVFYEAGRVAAEVARRGGQRWEESASHLATTMLGAFNPIGFSWEGRSAQEALVSLIMPSALDPVVDLSQNRDFTGRPIMPEENQFGPQDPDFRRYWPGVDKKWKAVTDFLNEASGGNKVEAGYVDVSPETLDYLAHTALGAAGALADRLIGLPAKTLAGEATREDIPLVRKAFGEKSPYRDKSEFYARMNEVEAKVKDGTDLIEAEMWGELDAFKADHERVLQMQPIAKEAKKVMRQIRKDRRANDGWLEKGQIDEAAHADNDARLDEIESTVVTNFNRQWISVVYGRDSEAQ